MTRWLAALILLLLFVAPAESGEARLMLSWNGPFGKSRASGNVDAACDSTRVDTLYLSFDPGRAVEHFLGASATLYFHSADGGSLGTFWKVDEAQGAKSPVRAVFEPDSARGFTTPWSPQGIGQARYDYTSGSGRVRLIYAIAANAGEPLKAGHTYGLARLLVRRPAASASGCGDPICVEWHSASLAFGPGDEPSINKGPRWAALNSAETRVCDSFRETTAPGAWHPKAPAR